MYCNERERGREYREENGTHNKKMSDKEQKNSSEPAPRDSRADQGGRQEEQRGTRNAVYDQAQPPPRSEAPPEPPPAPPAEAPKEK